jgi:hypothetical protein
MLLLRAAAAAAAVQMLGELWGTEIRLWLRLQSQQQGQHS